MRTEFLGGYREASVKRVKHCVDYWLHCTDYIVVTIALSH